MIKRKTSFDQAITEYAEFLKEPPAIDQILRAYHEYAKCWKAYDGFKDYLLNMA